MNSIKTCVTGLFLGLFFLVPSFSHATTLGDIQAQIANLLAQISSLQTQLAATQSDVVPGTAHAPYCMELSHTFGYGATDVSAGGEVSKLQTFLINQGLLSGTATGYFGPHTLAAIKSFQSTYGISESSDAGIIDSATRAKLSAWCDTNPIVPTEPELTATPSLSYSINILAGFTGDSWQEGSNIDGVVLDIKNTSNLNQTAIFLTSCLATYKLYDANGTMVFDFGSVQHCVSNKTTQTLTPGNQYGVRIDHLDSYFHLKPGKYVMKAHALNVNGGTAQTYFYVNAASVPTISRVVAPAEAVNVIHPGETTAIYGTNLDISGYYVHMVGKAYTQNVSVKNTAYGTLQFIVPAADNGDYTIQLMNSNGQTSNKVSVTLTNNLVASSAKITGLDHHVGGTTGEHDPETFTVFGSGFTRDSVLAYTDTYGVKRGTTGTLTYVISFSTTKIIFAGDLETGNQASIYRVKLIDGNGNSSNEIVVDTIPGTAYNPVQSNLASALSALESVLVAIGNSVHGVGQVLGASTQAVSPILSLSEDASNPSAGYMVAKATTSSGPFSVLAFDINDIATSTDLLVSSLKINVTSLATSTPANAIISSATLSVNGSTSTGFVGSDNTITFSGLHITIGHSSKVVGRVSLTLSSQEGHYGATGASLRLVLKKDGVQATTMNSDHVIAVSAMSGSAMGNKQKIVVGSIVTVSKVSASAVLTYNANNPSRSYGTYVLKFDVTAVGGDIYVPNMATTTSLSAVIYAVSGTGSSSFKGASTASFSSTADSSSSTRYIVHDGDTKTFTLSVSADPTTTGDYTTGISKIRFGTTPTGVLKQLNFSEVTDFLHIPN